MKVYYCITLALLLVVVTPIDTRTPSCDQTLIKYITDFWAAHGIPRDVLKRLETIGDYVIVNTVSNIQEGKNKCILMRGSSSKNTLSFLYTPKYNNGKHALVDNDVTEKNGIISSTRTGQQVYNIIVSNDIIVGYICNSKSGEKGAPHGFIAVAPNNWSDDYTQTFLKNNQELMRILGFQFKYTYEDECF